MAMEQERNTEIETANASSRIPDNLGLDGNTTNERNVTNVPQDEVYARNLKALRPKNPVFALGLAVNHLMKKTPFCDLKFGEWSRILAGQINRNHYLFVVNDGDVVGFTGWAFVSRDQAEAWISGKSDSIGASPNGDNVVINVWEAGSTAVNDFMRDQLRKIFEEKEMIYARRVLQDGGVRPIRLKVNQFAGPHIAEP